MTATARRIRARRPTRSTTKTTNKPRPEDQRVRAEDLLESRRQEAIAMLDARDDQFLDEETLPHLLRTTQALILTNSEIWDRIEDHLSSSHYGGFVVLRVAMSDIQVTSKKNKRTCVEVIPKFHAKDFDALPKIPSELLEALFLPSDQDSEANKLPDYEVILKRVTLFHESIMIPFLVKLKDHLETLQVCLGQVEGWISEPHYQFAFLEKLFNVELDDRPQVQDFLTPCRGSQCNCKVDIMNQYCVECRKDPFQRGSKLNYAARTRKSEPIFESSLRFNFSPNFPACFPQAAEITGVPKKVWVSSSGRSAFDHSESFDLLDKADKTRLAKLMEYIFLAHNITSPNCESSSDTHPTE